MVYTFAGVTPQHTDALYIAPNSSVIGRVELGELTSVWFAATIRGDITAIRVGEGSNVQDGSVLHVDHGVPLSIGRYVTVGHQAILHGCTIADSVLVGMGSVVLNGAVVGEESIVGAGALVAPGKQFPPRSLLIGVPARVVRTVSDEEVAETRRNADHYIDNARKYADGLEPVG